MGTQARHCKIGPGFRGRSMATNPLKAIRFSPEDRALLYKLAEREQLKTTDIIRRALHFYAENSVPTRMRKTRKVKSKP